MIASMKQIHIGSLMLLAAALAGPGLLHPCSCQAQKQSQLLHIAQSTQAVPESIQQTPGTFDLPDGSGALPLQVIDVGTGTPVVLPAQPGTVTGDSQPGSTSSEPGAAAAQGENAPQRMVPTELLQQAAVLLQQRGNALKDLFTPQPQYPTSQTIFNPQPAAPAAGQLNPLKGLFTPQPQYPTPQSIMNPHASPADGEHNHFKGLFTPQPQYPTPQTIMNPEAEPRHLVPERVIKWPGASGLAGSNSTPAEAANDKRGTGQSPVPPSAGRAGEAPPAAGAPAVAPHAPPDISPGGVHAEAPYVKHLKEAILLMNARHYVRSVEALTRILDAEPHNAQAHYIRAVNYVHLRKYAEAAADYRQVMALQPNTVLSSMAAEGLKKIGY